MNTSAQIGMVHTAGHVRSIYCHWDGQPEFAGRTLNLHWTDREKIKELLRLGRIKNVTARIENITPLPVREQVLGRRGASYSKSVAEYIDFYTTQSSVNYVYLFEGGAWNVCETLFKLARVAGGDTAPLTPEPKPVTFKKPDSEYSRDPSVPRLIVR